MKLKDYIKGLQAMLKVYPTADVVYAIDEEGNAFHPVEFAPGAGYYDKREQSFYPEGQEDFIEEKRKVNAVCIN